MRFHPKRWPAADLLALLVLSSMTALLATAAFVHASVWAEKEPVVRMFLFYSESCSHCQEVMEDVLPVLRTKYGSQLEVMLFEISDPINLRTLAALEKAYGVPVEQAVIPEIFVGRDVFLGGGAIAGELEATIDGYLAQGGVDLTPPMRQALEAAARLRESAATLLPTGAVHAVLFHMPTCGHCEEVIQNVLPGLKQRYGDRFQLKLIDVTDNAAYEKFIGFVQRLVGEKGMFGVPTLVIADTVMLGANTIREQADGTIQRYLALGGAAYPELPAGLDGPEYQLGNELPALTSTPSPVVVLSPTPLAVVRPTTGKVIHLAYFHQPGCQECDRVQMALDFLRSRYPQLEVTRFDVKEYAALNEWLCERAGVPEVKRLTAPAIFVGGDALIGDDILLDSLEALIQKYQESGAPKVWEAFASEDAEKNIIARFRSLGALTVVGAGLVDGLNPCAFATLVFFISYLSLSGRKGREVLAVGSAFALGVFLAYLLVGLGLWKALGAFGYLARIGRWVYMATAALCLVLAVLSLLDFFKARRGSATDMVLSLPRPLRARINAVIRGGQQARAFVPVAFVTGAVVSLIELACTGQVYLPTIIFVLSVPELRLRAFAYLVLYNLFFILPLIIVFVIAYYGTSTARLMQFLRTRTAPIKLATSVLFLVLAGWLVYALV